MLAEWMTYGIVVAALVSLAAWAVEAWLRSEGRPVRWVWTAAPVLSLGLPLLALLTNGRWPGSFVPWAGSAVELRATLSGSLPAGSVAGAPGMVERAIGVVTGDAVLGVCWGLATVAAGAWYAGVWLRLSAASRTWRRARVAGSDVLVSGSGGPAAVGLLRPTIVVPEWLLGVSEAVQRVVLLHETEHVRSRDHALLALAPLPLILFPWNLVLVWQIRRLRLAVELDCDRRVLARGVEVGQYASLLLQIAARSRGPVLAVPLARPDRRPLEARLLDMTRGPTAGGRVWGIVALAAAACILAVACEADPPLQPEPHAAALVAASSGPRIGEAAGGPLQSLVEHPLSGAVEVFIDGERASPEQTAALRADAIASIEVQKSVRAGIDAGEPVAGRIRIRTKAAVGDAGPEGSTPYASSPAGPIDLRSVLGDPAANVSVLIDGLPASRADALALRPADIARVEVLKTRNRGGAAAGQIRISTKAGADD